MIGGCMEKKENLVYGKQFNRKWMVALWKIVRSQKTFTFKQASAHYHKTHPNDTCYVGMNCGNYLAGAITKKWVVRVSRGVYRWTALGRFQASFIGGE